MQKKALILHAWLSNPNDHWYLWLKTELKIKDTPSIFLKSRR
ncbi:MAG: hypothetical protein AAB492_01510 [Patescibacteria group bacterium]